MALLDIRNLTISFLRDGSYHEVVHNISYQLEAGTTLGIVGESGSGKSVSSMSIMRLLPTATTRISGNIFLNGEDLLSYSESQMQQVRGSRVSMIFQEPMTALNPVQRCGQQVVEMLLAHEKVSKQEAKQRTIDLFKEVQLPRPEKIFDAYPFEISGGQKQRVMIAMALICNPEIIIADEPTTALDVTVQKSILDLLKQLQQKRNIAIIFISHDLGVIAQISQQVLVMYQGSIVEQGNVNDILTHPKQPYTQGLLACRPTLDYPYERLLTVGDFLSGNSVQSSMPLKQPRTYDESETPLLSVNNLSVTYTLKRSFLGKPLQQLKGVDSISFNIFKGETLGLVGESGCGKTTLGRSLLQLINSSSGSVTYCGQALNELSPKQLQQLRPKLQIIFQDPYSSLNPRVTIGDAIMEPLKVHHIYESDEQRKAKVLELMTRVGLDSSFYHRYPHEFSGGQRQRVCIARALITMPELVICDESVSALDVSVQAQVLNLLNELKSLYGFTYLFITHDLSVVKFISDRIMVMRQGRLVEINTTDALFEHPQQHYTQNLIDSIPKI